MDELEARAGCCSVGVGLGFFDCGLIAASTSSKLIIFLVGRPLELPC